MSTNSTDDIGREAGGHVTRGTKMPGSTFDLSKDVIQFFGFYGPRTIHLPIIMDTPNSIWYWVHDRSRHEDASALARARVHMQARTRRNSD